MAYVPSAYESPELSPYNRRFPEVEDPSASLSSSSSSSTSSIGKNSDGLLGGDRAVMKKRCRVNIKEDHRTIWTLRRKFCLEKSRWLTSRNTNRCKNIGRNSITWSG